MAARDLLIKWRFDPRMQKGASARDKQQVDRSDRPRLVVFDKGPILRMLNAIMSPYSCDYMKALAVSACILQLNARYGA
jgi:hypothetical protein